MRKPRRSSPGASRHLRHALALAAAACGSAHAQLEQAQAQEQGSAPTAVFSPNVALEETYVETRGRITGENGRELVSRLSPGFRYTSTAGRVRGSIDYAADLLYRRGRGETEGGDVQNQLNAAFLTEAVPNWLFIDTRASIAQQTISAFGEQSVAGSTQFNQNRTEVSTLSVSPYVHGPLGRFAQYEVRLLGGASDSKSPDAVDSKNASASFSVASAPGAAIFGWSLSGLKQRIKYSGQEAVDNSNVEAMVSLTPAPEVRLSVTGGRESIEDAGFDSPNHSNTAGLGLLWTPSPRTSLSADITERYFGRAKHISFTHRAQHTAWSYTLTRDTTNGAERFTQFGQATRLQLAMNDPNLASLDPLQREQAALNALIGLGLDPNEPVPLGALASGYSLQRRQDLSFAWYGARLSFSLQGYTTALSPLTLIEGADPLAGEEVVEHGYSSTLSYKLTPQTSVGFGGSRQMIFATATMPGTDLKSAHLTLTSQIGRRTTGQVGARYTVFNSTTDPYRETSLSASISLRF